MSKKENAELRKKRFDKWFEWRCTNGKNSDFSRGEMSNVVEKRVNVRTKAVFAVDNFVDNVDK